MLSWVMALNRFAIAAESIGMWTYAAAQVHLELCAKLAGMCNRNLYNVKLFSLAFVCLSARAGADPDRPRRHHLAQIYDDLVRKEWAEKSMKGSIFIAYCFCFF